MEHKISPAISEMKVVACGIKGLLLIARDPNVDERGFFREVCRKNLLGKDFDSLQINHSMTEMGYIRGIHGEKWDKLAFPVTGKMFAAIVDLRPESETFGRCEEFYFDCDDELPSRALFIPSGLGNSICAIKGPVHYIYEVSAYWTPDSSFAVNPFDPDLNIHWPVDNPKLKNEDRNAPTLRDLFPEKFK